MRQVKLLITIFMMLVCATSNAQDAAIKKIIEIGQNDNRTMYYLDILTNRFGGRLTGSGAYEDARDWVVKEFKEMGLEVKLEEAGQVPVGFNRGPWFGRMLGEESMNLHFVTPSCTSGTHGIQRGHVVCEPQSRAEFNRMKGLIKGAWVLVEGLNSGWPLYMNAKEDSIRQAIIAENEVIAKENAEGRMKAYQNRTEFTPKPLKKRPGLFMKEMIEAGALGFIQRSEVPLRALYDRPMMNDMSVTFDKLPTWCDIKLDAAQYDKIRKMAEERRDIQLEFDIRNHFRMGPIKYHNVVATIKGTEKPEECIIIGAHLDAFDSATGGVDDGNGICVLMETARQIMASGAKPKRSIVFVAFAAEEFGLFGSLAYVKAHKNQMPNVVNMFNRDGGPLAPTAIRVPEEWYDDMVKVCEPVKQIRADYPFEVVKVPARRQPTAPGGSDDSSFGMAGVPTCGFTLTDPEGLNFEYGEIWHTERDVMNKSIAQYNEHASTVTAVVALGMANLKKRLPASAVYSK